MIQRYREQLGMSKSTAHSRLVRIMLFTLAQKCGLDICFRCGTKIENSKDFNLDHVVDWLDSDNPPQLFWDLDNIKFSHDSCNKRFGRKPTKFSKGENRHIRLKQKSSLSESRDSKEQHTG